MLVKRLVSAIGVTSLGGLVVVALSACGASSTELAAQRAKSNVDAYFQALNTYPGSAAEIDAGLVRFEAMYRDLTAAELGDLVETVYAESIFFNDTLHTFTDRASLKAYMTETGANLATSQVEIQQVVSQGADVFVRWTMYFEAGESDTPIQSHSIGISHLRFNDDGQVILHQDYWDSAGGLYTHLPVIGALLRAAQKELGKPD